MPVAGEGREKVGKPYKSSSKVADTLGKLLGFDHKGHYTFLVDHSLAFKSNGLKRKAK